LGATGIAAVAETELILKSAASSGAGVRPTHAAAARQNRPPRRSGDLADCGLAALGDGTFEFRHTVKRLIDMQSEDSTANRRRR
jgi:hypothetical protein